MFSAMLCIAGGDCTQTEFSVRHCNTKNLLDSIHRVYFNDTVFCDITESFSCDTLFMVRVDTFKRIHEDWYIKRFGKYELFLGANSFKTDSIVIVDTGTKSLNEIFGNGEMDIVYPISDKYYPIRISSNNIGGHIYTYRMELRILNHTYYEYDVEFDPCVGIIRLFGGGRYECLDGYCR